MKSEIEIRAKLDEMLALDGRIQLAGMQPGGVMFAKAAACKTLLWALGVNDDDRYFITAKPGRPLLQSEKDRN